MEIKEVKTWGQSVCHSINQAVCACAYVCDIDPHHATVTGLRVASTQEIMGTDSRWQRQSRLTLAKCYFLIGGIAGGLVFCVHRTCYVLQSKRFGINGGRWYNFRFFLCPSICLHTGAHCHFVRHHKGNFHWSGKIHRPDNRWGSP